LTAQEVAARLGISERWVRDHATRRNPRIPAIKLGPLVRFRWADVQAFVAAMETTKDFNRR
jgi:excisionase family DNA binding protein